MIRHSVFAFHHGQSDERLYIDDGNGITIAYLDYSVYEGKPAIQMIRSSVTRQGLARSLILKLQSLYPDTEIDLGMLTDDGAALINSLKFKTIIDPVMVKKTALLDRVKAKIADLEANVSPDNIKQFGDIWNRLYDMERRLEDEIDHGQMSKRIIVG